MDCDRITCTGSRILTVTLAAAGSMRINLYIEVQLLGQRLHEVDRNGAGVKCTGKNGTREKTELQVPCRYQMRTRIWPYCSIDRGAVQY